MAHMYFDVNASPIPILFLSKNILSLDLNLCVYEAKLNESIEYFGKYNIERKSIKIDPSSSNIVNVNITYEKGTEVDSKKIYEEWIAKMEDLINETNLINSKLNSEKQKIIKYHNKSIIIN